MDLDYFCWDDSLLSVPEKRVEITKEAYEGCLADRYHPLRLLPARTVKPQVVGGGEVLPRLLGRITPRSASKRPADSEEDRKTHQLLGRPGRFAEGHRRLPFLHLGLSARREGGIRRGEFHEASRRALSAADGRAARHLHLTQKRPRKVTISHQDALPARYGIRAFNGCSHDELPACIYGVQNSQA